GVAGGVGVGGGAGGGGRRGVGGERARREPRFRDQCLLDPLIELAARGRREQRAGDGERDGGGGERGEKELRLKRRPRRSRRDHVRPPARDRRACSRTASP